MCYHQGGLFSECYILCIIAFCLLFYAYWCYVILHGSFRKERITYRNDLILVEFGDVTGIASSGSTVICAIRASRFMGNAVVGCDRAVFHLFIYILCWEMC